MLGQLILLLILSSVLCQSASRTDSLPPSYEDVKAYEVYSAVLPLEWPLQVAHAKELVIRRETQSYEMCLRPEKEWDEKIRPAISDYVKLNASPWLLQREFDIEIPYQLLTADELKSIAEQGGTEQGGWNSFSQQYPDSGGWIELSAVGFNADKTVAVVYVGHHCGMQCGGGGFHVLEKRDGKWAPMDWKGARCGWVS